MPYIWEIPRKTTNFYGIQKYNEISYTCNLNKMYFTVNFGAKRIILWS